MSKSAYCLWACRMHCQQRRGRRQGLFEIVSRCEGKKGICLSLTLSTMTVKSKLVPRRWERDMSSFRFSSQSSSQLDFSTHLTNLPMHTCFMHCFALPPGVASTTPEKSIISPYRNHRNCITILQYIYNEHMNNGPPDTTLAMDIPVV